MATGKAAPTPRWPARTSTATGEPRHRARPFIPPSSASPQPATQLLPQVYEELRRLAARRLATEPAGQTLQPTALVHEAWLRLHAGAPTSSRLPPRPCGGS